MSGSVAAYKAAMVARALIGAGARVVPLMTRGARRFIGAATLSGLTGEPARWDMFREVGEPHVDLARTSDLVALVPATADLLARLAHGRADDLVAATVLCARCPVVFAPAMHPQMWGHPITQANVERLRSLPNWHMLGPVWGEVASGERGMGRMLEPESIAAEIERVLRDAESRAERASGADLSGRHVVVSAGPTVEDLDPVRCLTNRSSGKMGFALARAAAARGARVTLVAGPVALSTPAGVARVDVRSALDMQAALNGALGAGQRAADALIMCAAVSDYRPATKSPTKLVRQNATTTLELAPNPDILAQIGAARSGQQPVLIGFAVETESGERFVGRARAKLASKRVDAIVANRASDALGGDDTRAVLISDEPERELGPGSKLQVADAILDFLVERLGRVP